MSSDIKFITCSEAEIPAIQTLADKVWRLHYPSIISIEQINFMLDKMYSTTSLLQQLKDGHQFIIASINDLPVGFISVSTKDKIEYFIHKLYVDVSMHRSGIGKQLLQYIYQQYPQAKIFTLTVNRQNIKAINFYFKNEFIINSVADFDIGGGFVMNDFIMKKQLT